MDLCCKSVSSLSRTVLDADVGPAALHHADLSAGTQVTRQSCSCYSNSEPGLFKQSSIIGRKYTQLKKKSIDFYLR